MDNLLEGNLVDTHQWFQLRDAVNGVQTSPLYRGAVEAAFNRSQSAQRYLGSVIASAPHSEQAYQAHDILTSLFMRVGDYQQALVHDKAMIAAKPNEGDAEDLRSLLVLLSHCPALSVVRREHATVPYGVVGGNMFVPVVAEGVPANYMIDTGATFSTMSESEAKRLKLTIHPVASHAETATGGYAATKVTVLRRLRVGNVVLANVAFLVMPDDQPPFDGLAPDHRGIIGVPVLLALNTLRWRTTGLLDIGFLSKPKNLSKANLCFEAMTVISDTAFQQSHIGLVVDSGATHSELWPNFARKFAKFVSTSGTKTSTSIVGIGGSGNYPVMLLPELTLEIGGLPTVLRPAVVLLQQDSSGSQWEFGTIGLDLLNQAHSTTIDFDSMTLTLE